MRFDDLWGRETDAPKSKSRPSNLPMPPDGRHTGEIISATEKQLAFKVTEDNRKGVCLVVVVDIPKHQPIEAIVPAHWRGLIEAIARAAGVAPPVPGEDWDEGVLNGRTVTVDVVQAISGKGTEYVRVEKWHPSPSQPLPATKAAPARSQSAKAHREFQSNSTAPDDIPF